MSRGVRLAVVSIIVLAGLVAPAPTRTAAASGSTLFAQSFSNNTVNAAYPVSAPALPSGASGSNAACLTASGNTSSGVLLSCPATNDAQGSGKLRLTAASNTQEGGVFAATSVPTSQGNDAAYNGDAAATAGAVAYTRPTLTWTGDLTPGGTATITYSVTVSNPDTGGRILTNTATSAAAGSTCPVGTSASPCTVSVDVISGSLSITASASADLGATPPGGAVGNSLGDVQVTDNRGFGVGWSAAVSSTDFITGGGSPVETIPVGDGSYAISGLTTTGSATFSHVVSVGLSGSPQAVVSATNVGGNTTVTWNPSVQIAVPGGAIGGTYPATITHSVS